MSRATSKSRAEKGRTPSAPVPPPPLAQSLEVVDIIPGRLTESDWVAMVAQEEGEEVVADILDELMLRVMDTCYRVYLQAQLVPFAVSQAQDALVQIMEWQFLMQDAGEGPDSASSWEEDSEPQPCISDSWAQGCVSLVCSKLTPHALLQPRLTEVPAEGASDPEVLQLKPKAQPVFPAGPPFTEPSEGKVKVEIKPAGSLTPVPPPKKSETRRRQPQLHRATLPALPKQDSLPPLRQPTSRAASLEERQDGASPVLKATPRLQPQNLPAVRKLDPTHRHCVWPGFEVLMTNATQRPSWKTMAKQKQGPRTHHGDVQRRPTHHDRSHKAMQRAALEGGTSLYPSSKSILEGGRIKGFLPVSASLLLENLQLSPGVSLRVPPVAPEKISTYKGESQPYCHADLKPIRSSLQVPLLSLDLLMSEPPPQVTSHHQVTRT